jgi:hypothetical protein
VEGNYEMEEERKSEVEEEMQMQTNRRLSTRIYLYLQIFAKKNIG